MRADIEQKLTEARLEALEGEVSALRNALGVILLAGIVWLMWPDKKDAS